MTYLVPPISAAGDPVRRAGEVRGCPILAGPNIGGHGFVERRNGCGSS